MAQDLSAILKLLQGTQPKKNMSEEVMSVEQDAKLANINEEATSPNMMTKPELAQKEIEQKLEQTPVGQAVEQAKASQVNNPIKAAAEAQQNNKPLSLEDLLAKRNQLDEKYQADIKTARESDKNKAMLANLVKSLGNLGAAEVQRKVGTQVGLKDFTPVQGPDTAGQLERDRQNRLNKLKEDMNILSSIEKSRKSGQMTPYQEQMLDYLRSKEDRLSKKDELGIKRFDFKKGETEKGRLEKVVKEFNADPVLRDSKKAIIAAEKAKSTINSNGKMAPAVMGRLLARMAGEVGVMTDQDVASFRGSSAWNDSLERYFQRGITGRLTDTDKQEMLRMVDALSKIENQAIEGYADNLSRQYSEAAGLDKDELMKAVLPKRAKEIYKNQPEKVEVVLPNGQRGRIDKDKVEAFRNKYPDAQVME